MKMLNQLLARIELEAQVITMDFDEEKEFPRGYLDGQLWGFDLVQMWIRMLQKGEEISPIKKT